MRVAASLCMGFKREFNFVRGLLKIDDPASTDCSVDRPERYKHSKYGEGLKVLHGLVRFVNARITMKMAMQEVISYRLGVSWQVRSWV